MYNHKERGYIIFQLMGGYCHDIPLLYPVITPIAPPRKLHDAFQPHSFGDSYLDGRQRACEKGVAESYSPFCSAGFLVTLPSWI
jgi:hypothetical protein